MSFRDRRGELLLEGEGTNYKDKLVYYEGVNLIGRNPAKTTLTIKDKSISEIHAKIICKNGTIKIVDAKSKNGVYLNDMQNPIAPEVEIEIDPKKDIIYFAQIKGKFVPDVPAAENQEQTKQFTTKQFKPNVKVDNKQPPKDTKIPKQEAKDSKKQVRQKSTKQKGKGQNQQKIEDLNNKKTKKLEVQNKQKEKQKEKQKKQISNQEPNKKQQIFQQNQQQKGKKQQKKKGKKESKEKNKSVESVQAKQQSKQVSIEKKNKTDKSKQSKQTRDEQALKRQQDEKKPVQEDNKKQNKNKKETKQKKSESSQTKVKENNKRKNKSLSKIGEQKEAKQKSLVNRKKLPDSLNDSFGNHPRRSIVHKTVLISGFTLGFKPTIKISITQNWRDPFDVLVMEKYGRTFKLLYAICLGIPVVTLNWVVQSEYRRGVVPYERFYLQGPQKQVIPKSLARTKQGQKVFTGLKFYLFQGEQSFHLPAEQVVALIQAGGGVLIKKINKKQVPAKDIIFILKNKYNDDDLKMLNKIEGVARAYTVEMVLDSCLYQEIKWDQNKVPVN